MLRKIIHSAGSSRRGQYFGGLSNQVQKPEAGKIKTFAKNAILMYHWK
jgi:hypothetical protein